MLALAGRVKIDERNRDSHSAAQKLGQWAALKHQHQRQFQ